MRWELILHDKQAGSGQGFKTDQVQGPVPGPGQDWNRPCLRPLELQGAAQNSVDPLTGDGNAPSRPTARTPVGPLLEPMGGPIAADCRLRSFREQLNFLKNPPLFDKAHGPGAKTFIYTEKACDR